MNFRTDLATEALEGSNLAEGAESRRISLFGIDGDIVEIKTDEAARMLQKPKGKYASFEADALINGNTGQYESISRAIAETVSEMLPLSKKQTALVAGLGNRNMTADSIGPKTVERIFVTRHIFEFMPEAVDERMRPVCALAPGVLGVTGVESADIISALCEKTAVDAVILIDALAARRKERMFSAIQITDTGIEPGAGVGNKRQGLNSRTLGIPTLSIGVPTVVYASTLVRDCLEGLTETEKMRVEVDEDMIVTPKDVDVIALDSARVIADGINLAMHGGMSLKEINGYMR